MKNFNTKKLISLFLFIFLSLLSVFIIDNTYAATCPNYSTPSGSNVAWCDAGAGSGNPTASGGMVLYKVNGQRAWCVDPGVPLGMVNCGSTETYDNEGFACVLADNGDNDDQTAIQGLIWKNIGKYRSRDTKCGGESGGSGEPTYGACSASASASLSVGNATMHYNSSKTYLVSNAITLSGGSGSVSASNGAQLVTGADGDGSVISSAGNGGQFYVRIPVAGLNSISQITVSASVTVNGTRKVCTTSSAGKNYHAEVCSSTGQKMMIVLTVSGEGTTAPDCRDEGCSASASASLGLHVPKGSLKIIKTDALDGHAIAGAKFSIYESDCSTKATYINRTEIGQITSGADGTVQVDNLYPATYCIKEDETIDSYLITTEAQNGIATTVNDGKVSSSTIKNIPLGKINIIKIDEETNQRLAGVKFELYKCNNATPLDYSNVTSKTCSKPTLVTTDARGAAVGENGVLTTNVVGEIFVKDLYYDMYLIKEYRNLDEYEVITSTIPVWIIANTQEGGVWHTAETTETIKNTPVEIDIYKKDLSTKSPLAGATITVIDANSSMLHKEYITTTDVFKLRFTPGDYILKESIAPAGYSVYEGTIFIHVDELGILSMTCEPETEKVVINGQELTIYDDRSAIYIDKKDITSGEELPGAQIVIKDKDGNIAKDIVTGDEIDFTSTTEPTKFHLDTNTEYTLKETVPPGADQKCLDSLTEGEDVTQCNYQVIENELTFKITDDGNVMVLSDDNQYYFVEANRITLYNGVQRVPVPDTGAFVSIITIAVGAAIAYFGYQMIVKKKMSF